MATKPSSEYSEGSIRLLKGLEPMKQRPAMFTRTDNSPHILLEVLDNAADEALAGHGKVMERRRLPAGRFYRGGLLDA